MDFKNSCLILKLNSQMLLQPKVGSRLCDFINPSSQQGSLEDMNLINLGTVCCVQHQTTSKCKNKSLSASFFLLLLVSWHRSKQQTHCEIVIQNFRHCQNFIADCLWPPDHDCHPWTCRIVQSPKILPCFSDNGLLFFLIWAESICLDWSCNIRATSFPVFIACMSIQLHAFVQVWHCFLDSNVYTKAPD